MSRRRYTEEFKVAAVRQITVEGHAVREVAERLGISTHSLYVRKRRYGETPERPRRSKPIMLRISELGQAVGETSHLPEQSARLLELAPTRSKINLLHRHQWDPR